MTSLLGKYLGIINLLYDCTKKSRHLLTLDMNYAHNSLGILIE